MDIVLWLVVLVALGATRLWWIRPRKQISQSRKKPCSTLVFLGSGGHTEEMTRLLKALDTQKYAPRIYVVAYNDRLSAEKAIALEQTLQGKPDADVQLHRIPRARDVGQSLASVPASFANAFFYASQLVAKARPDLMILNGPGSCLPLVVMAYALRFMGIKKTTLVYVESFARVEGLSLTGRLLYGWVDLFVVQWPDLVKKYPKAQYLGCLI
ncbi:UDP-N-acetylglucosamine transferase subunit ALG14 [Gongronella butleri]|nr:UDP-N-acetylglucosamine transferase subunit ALG14 [Gongronella butleri]